MMQNLRRAAPSVHAPASANAAVALAPPIQKSWMDPDEFLGPEPIIMMAGDQRIIKCPDCNDTFIHKQVMPSLRARP